MSVTFNVEPKLCIKLKGCCAPSTVRQSPFPVIRGRLGGVQQSFLLSFFCNLAHNGEGQLCRLIEVAL